MNEKTLDATLSKTMLLLMFCHMSPDIRRLKRVPAAYMQDTIAQSLEITYRYKVFRIRYIYEKGMRKHTVVFDLHEHREIYRHDGGACIIIADDREGRITTIPETSYPIWTTLQEMIHEVFTEVLPEP